MYPLWVIKTSSVAENRDTRIVDRTIVTIQVISCLATIIVMALILTMVGASIYGVLVTVH
jgi:hypothetical protein